MFITEVSAPAKRGALVAVLGWLALVTLGGAAFAQAALPDVLAARVSTTSERARLIVDLSDTTQFAMVSLADPDRIAVDIKAASVKIGTAPQVAGAGIVGSFTISMADTGRARAELVLAQPAVVQQAYVLEKSGDQPARLVVDLIGTSELDFKAHAAADLANSIARTSPDLGAASGASPAPDSQASETTTTPASSEPPAPDVAESEASQPPVASSASPPATPPAQVAKAKGAANAPPSVSKPLIVLDPGHGGIDNGASAPNGDHEKNITLAFALQLRDALVQSGQFDVALTRDDDTYLTLNDRVTVARQNKADLLISLHADTFQAPDVRGASIYTRDETATDILDKVLADGENRADIVAGYVQPPAPPAVVDILVELMRRQARQRAYLAAEDIVKAMEPSVALRRFPVRQADFFVLQAPDVPSMLIELGFLSNTDDIKNLEDPDWRTKMVAAIAQGVESYFTDLGPTR